MVIMSELGQHLPSPSTYAPCAAHITLDGDCLADFRHHGLGRRAFQSIDEFLRSLIDDGEAPVVARDCFVEVEIATAGERSHCAAHSKAIADRDDSDDQCHVTKDVGVAHVIERLVIGEMEDEAGRIAEIDILPVFHTE